MKQVNTDRQTNTKVAPQIKIVMQQMAFQVGDITANADRIIAASIKASSEGADLVVFPELALVGYPPEDLLHRQGFLQQVQKQTLRIQQELKHSIGDTAVVFGLPYVHAGALYNAALFLSHGIVRQFCFKQSLPNYSVFDEVRYFSAGHEITIIDVKGHKIALLICEDIWPQELVKQAKARAAQAIMVLNASSCYVNKHAERLTILSS